VHSRIDERLITVAAGDSSNRGGREVDGASRVLGRRRTDIPSTAALVEAAIQVTDESTRSNLVLAISGGCDSMALLHAMARWAPQRIAAVATFDHGTGGHATEASALVAAEARRMGLTVVRERARALQPTESAWREARWDFLRRVAGAYKAQVATAHTRDDQLETVVMRILRGSGARGLAALGASSTIVRPWLPVTRAEVESWARENDIVFVEDPANLDRRHLRVRVRLDLLPALEAAHPGFAEEMLAVAEKAANWRREVDAALEQSGVVEYAERGDALRVQASLFENLDDEQRAIYVQALFGRIGVALDSSGTRELVRFSRSRRRGAQIPLAGGASALLVRQGTNSVFEFRRPVRSSPFSAAPRWTGPAKSIPRRVGRWRFTPQPADSAESSTWIAALPVDAPVLVRPWQAGDRIQSSEKSAQRRVARYFVEAGIPAPDRRNWPVVLVNDEVVWVPGVCRSHAVPNRPGRPDLIWYRCEREQG
jgi:tRNA(Ile)-lysidine synthase